MEKEDVGPGRREGEWGERKRGKRKNINGIYNI